MAEEVVVAPIESPSEKATNHMPYVTSFERIGRQEGRQEEAVHLIARLARKRFPEFSSEDADAIRSVSSWKRSVMNCSILNPSPSSASGSAAHRLREFHATRFRTSRRRQRLAAAWQHRRSQFGVLRFAELWIETQMS